MADDETEEQTEENATEEKKGGKTKLIVIAVVVVVVLAVGGFFAVQAVMNETSPPVGQETEAVVEKDPDKPALFASLHPPLVVNFGDAHGESHFMQLTLEVMARDQSVIDEVKNHAAVIRNSLILMYGSVDYETVTTREGKEQMLADALAEIRSIVETETGKTGVEAVYFTSLIIQ